MKPLAFAPPAVALILGGIWIGTKRQAIARLDQQNILLETHMASVRATTAPGDGAATVRTNDSHAHEKAIDWKKVASYVLALDERHDARDVKELMRLHEQVTAMDEQELLAALDEIAGLDLPKENLAALEHLLASQLAQKAPEAFLNRFIHRTGDQNQPLDWELRNAFSGWANKNPGEAVAWFDRQIAAGGFDSKSLDGKSQPRLQFEGVLVAELILSDPAMAKNRIAALPAEHRTEALRHARGNYVEAAAPAYADLVREQLPTGEQPQALANVAPIPQAGDYGKATHYLSRIAATPAEREACVEKVGERSIQRLSYEREIQQEDLDRQREWAAKEAPGSVDRATGKALANMRDNGDGTKFARAVDLALHFHDKGGGDDLLLPLLDHSLAEEHPDTARKLAARISDEKKREEILRELQ